MSQDRKMDLVAAIVILTGKTMEEVQAAVTTNIQETLLRLEIPHRQIPGEVFSETYYEGVWKTKMPTTHHADRFPEFFKKVRFQRFIAETKEHICIIKNGKIQIPNPDKKSLRINTLWEILGASETVEEPGQSFPGRGIPGDPDPAPSARNPGLPRGVPGRSYPTPEPFMRREGGPLTGMAQSYAAWALQRLISGGKDSRDDAIEFLKVALDPDQDGVVWTPGKYMTRG
jgi:hypothetical protein